MKIEHDFKMKVDDNLFISVFNSHEIDLKKADKGYEAIYGKRKLKQLKDSIKKYNGLMSIFGFDPTDDLIMYSLMITQAQNQQKNKGGI